MEQSAGRIFPGKAAAAGAGVEADSGGRPDGDQAEPVGDGVSVCHLFDSDRAVLHWAAKKLHQIAVQKAMLVTELTPPPMDPALNKMGGGGGQKGPTPVTKGRLPKFADTADYAAEGPSAGGAEDPDAGPDHRGAEGPEDGEQHHAELWRSELAAAWATRWGEAAARGWATATARDLGRGRGADMAAG